MTYQNNIGHTEANQASEHAGRSYNRSFFAIGCHGNVFIPSCIEFVAAQHHEPSRVYRKHAAEAEQNSAENQAISVEHIGNGEGASAQAKDNKGEDR